MRGGVALALVLAAACHTQPVELETHKPEAPVTITASARLVAAGVYEVEVTAAPTVDVRGIEIEIFSPDGAARVGANATAAVGPTRAGTTVVHAARVELAGAGAVIVASARVDVAPGVRPNRITELALGVPPRQGPPTPPRRVVLSSGEIVEEVRP
jgi:hypothetical protein